MASTELKDGRARLLLVLLTVIGICLLAIPFFLTPPAALRLLLRDEVFASSLAGKRAHIAAGGMDLSVAVANAEAGFVAHVPRFPSGPADLRVEVEGYRPASLPIVAKPLRTNDVPVALVPTFGRLELSVVDARDATRAVPARIEIDGTALAGAPQSSAILTAPPGTRKLRATAPGFCAAESRAAVRERETTKALLPLSPAVEGNQLARIILDWAENPRDLDSHLQLTDSAAAASSAHVYYVNKRGITANGQVFAELDVDYVNSEGFETVTVYNKASGVYKYFVHLFAGQGTLGSSQATVEILTHGCEGRRYSVPPECNHRWWHVADLEVSPSGVALRDRSACVETPGARFAERRK